MDLSVRDYKRDLKILYMRDKLNWTFAKIGKEYNISKARARQVYIRVSVERKENKHGKEN
jgi:hypothetical protein